MAGTEAVLQHLLFHRALLGDGEDGADLAHYASMVEQMGRGIHLTAEDPLERSVAAVFELVIQEQMDPWGIDLVQFCRLYLQKVRSEEAVHFVTAGRLVFMAWSVLRLQSEGILGGLGSQAPSEEGLVGWDMEPMFYQSPEDEDYTFAVLGDQEVPLVPPVRREVPRPVTLMDLVRAFNEALREVEASALKGPRPVPQDPTLRAKVHAEDLVEEIAWAWARLKGMTGSEVPLSEVWPRGREQGAALFVALLFLARMGWIELLQEELPRGEVTIRVVTDADKADQGISRLALTPGEAEA
jgi:segregation and condensation protein A